MESRYPTFEPPKTKLLEEDPPVRSTGPDRRPSAPLAIAAAVGMVVAVLLGFISMTPGNGDLAPVSYGGLFLSIAQLGVAVWRYDTGARVALCSTIPW